MLNPTFNDACGEVNDFFSNSLLNPTMGIYRAPIILHGKLYPKSA
jgi:hypothetical protein